MSTPTPIAAYDPTPPAASSAPPDVSGFGIITLDGIPYIERPAILTQQTTITTANQLFENLPFTLPGAANFLLKGLTRDILGKTQIGGLPGSVDRRFRFKLSNAQGSTWFFSGGLGILDDLTVDTLCFGSAQFPYMLIPPVAVPANATLTYYVQDMGLQGINLNYFPYTIYFAFHGSYLIPAGTRQ